MVTGGMPSIGDALNAFVRKQLGDLRDTPEYLDDADTIAELVRLNRGGDINDAAFDSMLEVEGTPGIRFARARFIWGIGSELWRLSEPIIDRRIAMHEARGEATEHQYQRQRAAAQDDRYSEYF